MQTAQSALDVKDETWSRLLQEYRLAVEGKFDEMLDASGQVRKHWEPVAAAMQAMPQPERILRSERIDRRVRDTGIAYDIFSDPSKPVQRWQLDLFPIAISSAEWRWRTARYAPPKSSTSASRRGR